MKARLLNIFLALALLAINNFARSANITWTNTAGGNWNNAQNWDLNQVPGSGDSASIPGGGINVLIDSTNSTGGFTLGGGSSLTIASNGVLNIDGGVEIEGVLTNEGTVTSQGGGDVDVANSAPNGFTGEIWNEAGALWNIQDNGRLLAAYGSAQFHNAGVLEKSVATGTTSFYPYLDNSGTVHAKSGTIQFNGGTDFGGSFQADANAAIYLNGGSFTLSSPPTNFQGPGTVQFTSINLTLDEFTGTYSLNSTIKLTGQNTVAAAGAITMSGAELDGGASLTVASNGVLNIDGSVQIVLIEGVLTNYGTVISQGGGDVGVANYAPNGYTGEIWNEAGALWDIQDNGRLLAEYGGETFHNAGVLEKSVATGTTLCNLYLNNTGPIHAESGTINFSGGSDLGGIFQADSGAAILFGGGSFTIISAPTNFQGPGTVQLAGGNVTLDGLVGTLNMNGPTLTGQNTVNGTGILNLLSGNVGPGASLTVASNGVLNIEGSVQIESVLTNYGTVTSQGDGDVDVANYAPNGYTGEIWNEAGALWDIQDNGRLLAEYGGETFHNAGVLEKSVATGTTLCNLYLNNTGPIHAESGTINFSEIYTETSSASQVIGISGTAPDSDYGQIQFSSPTFAGSFNVTLLNGFRPSPGDSFSVLSYPSITGDFTSMDGLDLGNGLKLVPQFGNTGLILVAATYPISAKPSLSLYNTPNDVLVSWPLNFTGWQLQTTTNLATHVWTPMSVPGTNNNIVLPRPGLKGFFRLKGS